MSFALRREGFDKGNSPTCTAQAGGCLLACARAVRDRTGWGRPHQQPAAGEALCGFSGGVSGLSGGLTRGRLTAVKMSDPLTSVSDSPPLSAHANLGYLFRLAYQRFRVALDEELKDLGLSAQEYGLL